MENLEQVIFQMSLLMIHAQDHLMNAMTVKDLAAEMVELYYRIN